MCSYTFTQNFFIPLFWHSSAWTTKSKFQRETRDSHSRINSQHAVPSAPFDFPNYATFLAVWNTLSFCGLHWAAHPSNMDRESNRVSNTNRESISWNQKQSVSQVSLPYHIVVAKWLIAGMPTWDTHIHITHTHIWLLRCSMTLWWSILHISKLLAGLQQLLT